MSDAHVVTGWVLIGLNALAGVWCLAAYRFQRGRGRAVWMCVIAAQLSAFVQAVLGVLLTRQEGVLLDDMHALYGFSAIVAVGILYSYRNSSFMTGKELLLYGFGSLFIMGLGLRNLYL